jgi:hypothetical protein
LFSLRTRAVVIANANQLVFKNNRHQAVYKLY